MTLTDKANMTDKHGNEWNRPQGDPLADERCTDGCGRRQTEGSEQCWTCHHESRRDWDESLGVGRWVYHTELHWCSLLSDRSVVRL